MILSPSIYFFYIRGQILQATGVVFLPRIRLPVEGVRLSETVLRQSDHQTIRTTMIRIPTVPGLLWELCLVGVVVFSQTFLITARSLRLVISVLILWTYAASRRQSIVT